MQVQSHEAHRSDNRNTRTHLHLSVSGIICLPITEGYNAEGPLSPLLLLFNEAGKQATRLKASFGWLVAEADLL
jgi:hypothetical protein